MSTMIFEKLKTRLASGELEAERTFDALAVKLRRR